VDNLTITRENIQVRTNFDILNEENKFFFQQRPYSPKAVLSAISLVL